MGQCHEIFLRRFFQESPAIGPLISPRGDVFFFFGGGKFMKIFSAQGAPPVSKAPAASTLY
jgi:hypothetical protein